ncbi:MAG: TonB-dependent receptor [Ignavibacteriales bacterium]|nr:TonB-dependent receptor [Ignavibacteriales bacterium]
MFSAKCTIRFLITNVILFSFLICNTFAGTTGKISGKATDAKSNEPLIGINVVLVGTSMGASTDVDGNYFILNIPPGVYQVKATGIGYAPVTITDVRVSVDQTTKIDIKLGEQVIQLENVIVTAARPIIQKDLTSTEAKISGDQISMLPLEDVQSVINLQAGVVDGHVRGGRSSEVKYLLDGVSVNDAFSGDASIFAEVNSVQEVQVITGTFNAEYGEALSGVVNQVTKIAGEKLSGDFSLYTGDYYTNRKSLFMNVDHISPKDNYNFQGNLSGPVPGTDKVVSFLLSGKYLYDDGFLYGKRIFNPSDSSDFSANDPKNWYITKTGDGKYVSMNFSRRYTLQGKLNFKLGNAKGLTLSGMYQDRKYKDYNHQYKYNPDGDYQKFQTTVLGSASYNHVFGKATFMDLIASYFSTEAKQYVVEDPLSLGYYSPGSGYHPGYVDPARLRDVSGNAFLTGGTENWQQSHKTRTMTAKLDLTSQIDNLNEIKAGVELNLHKLDYKDFQIHVDAESNFKPTLPQPGNFDYNTYSNNPYQFSGYIQDKIELDYLIVNVGVRFDYFQPDGEVILYPDSLSALDALKPPFPDNYFKKAKVKYQLSPRLGISYPMSDKGAIHISYGHFFQIPPFEFLYRNPNFRIPLTGSFPDFVGNMIGNADLEPQRTTIYEIGLQQALTDVLGISVTAYYKDIRNLLGTEIHIKNDFKKFAKFINRDYGAVSGFIISLDKRFSEGFAANIDYTYQIAKGNASDPNDAFNKAQANPPVEANKQLVLLDWDRRHSLNFTVTYGEPDNFIASLIGRLGSGLPYTPALQNQRTGLENSDTRPAVFNIDLYVTKYLKFLDNSFAVFLKVYNLFDTANELNIFNDTGRAGYSLEVTRAQQQPRGINTIQEYYTRPDFYSAPRQIILGASVSF